MNITVYDAFAPGDTVRLVQVANREFLTGFEEVRVAVPCASVTFASMAARDEVVLIVDRATAERAGRAGT